MVIEKQNVDGLEHGLNCAT